jgi:hypothetical protein
VHEASAGRAKRDLFSELAALEAAETQDETLHETRHVAGRSRRSATWMLHATIKLCTKYQSLCKQIEVSTRTDTWTLPDLLTCLSLLIISLHLSLSLSLSLSLLFSIYIAQFLSSLSLAPSLSPFLSLVSSFFSFPFIC